MKKVPCDKKVVLFGELMMRLSTKRHERIVQAGRHRSPIGHATFEHGFRQFLDE